MEKKYYKVMLLLFIGFNSTSAYSSWNAQCLDDCFSTHHECNYCDYQCEVTDKPHQERIQTNQYVCPFEVHNYY